MNLTTAALLFMLISGPPVQPELIGKRGDEITHLRVNRSATQLVYEVPVRNGRTIRQVRLLTGEVDTLEPEDRPIRDLSWSHHRFRPLLNALTDSGRWALWIGGKEPSSPSAASDMHGTVSPNKKWIAFSSGRTGSGDIYLALTKKNQQSPRRITRNPEPELYPQWSPDGKQLLFIRVAPKGRSLILLSGVNGSTVQERVLADSREGVLSARWRPDGKSVAFFGRDWGAGTSIFVADTVMGGHKKVIGNVLPNRMGPAWIQDKKGHYLLLAITTTDQLLSINEAGDLTTINTGLLGHGEVTAATFRKKPIVFVTALGRTHHEDADLRFRKLYKFELK